MRSFQREMASMEIRLELKYNTRLDLQGALIQGIQDELERGRDAWRIARAHELEKANKKDLDQLRNDLESEYATLKFCKKVQKENEDTFNKH